MIKRIQLISILLLCISVSCENPFAPKPSEEGSIFKVGYTLEGENRIISTQLLEITWPNITVEDFARYVILRTVDNGDSVVTEGRGEVLNPLIFSFTDSIGDDVIYQYRVRIMDTFGNYREGRTAKIVMRTTSVYIPSEFPSVQDAFNSLFVDDEDTLILEEGLFSPPFRLIGKEVTVMGAGSVDQTILMTNSSTALVETEEHFKQVIEIGSLFLDQGQITGVTISGSGGVHLSGTATISDCIINEVFSIDEDKYTYGYTGEIESVFEFRRAGIVAEGNSIVERCIISNCRKSIMNGIGGDGGGIILKGNAMLKNCDVKNNYSIGGGGGALVYENPSIFNCIFNKNSSGEGGGGIKITSDASPLIQNCVLFDNNSDMQSGGALFSEGTFDFSNNIVWDNSFTTSDRRTLRVAKYSDIEGFDLGSTNISVDPQFVDPSSGDFHLQSGSPCVDAGNPDPEFDDGDGTINDMGAYGGLYGDDW